MGTVLERRYTEADGTMDILRAIELLAADKLGRVLLADDNEWKHRKLEEIGRLARILLSRPSLDNSSLSLGTTKNEQEK